MMYTIASHHPLYRSGVRTVRIAQAKEGYSVDAGDVVFEFPGGSIIHQRKTGSLQSIGDVPIIGGEKGVHPLLLIKEALLARGHLYHQKRGNHR